MGAGSITVRIAGYDLGIRWNHPGLEDEIRALFAAHVVEDDADVPANISFKLADPDLKVRGKTAMMMANRTMVLTASDERALRAGVQLLDSEIRWGRGESLVQAVPLVSEARTVLLDAHLRPRLRKIEPRLARAGFQVVDTFGVLLDPATGAVSIPEPCFEYDDAVLQRAGESSRDDRASGAIPDGQVDVAHWVMFRQGLLGDSDSDAHELISTIPILRSRQGTLSAGLLSAMGHRLGDDEVRWVSGAIDDKGLLDAVTNDDWEPEEPS